MSPNFVVRHEPGSLSHISLVLRMANQALDPHHHGLLHLVAGNEADLFLASPGFPHRLTGLGYISRNGFRPIRPFGCF